MSDTASLGGWVLLDFQLRAAGEVVATFSAEADPRSANDLRALLRSAVHRAGGADDDLGNYELDLLDSGGSVARTFVALP